MTSGPKLAGLRRARGAALAALFVAIPVLSIHAQSQKSATFDEPINLFHGLQMLATRDVSVPMDYAPLPRLAAAASARLFGPAVRHAPERTPWVPGILPQLAQRVLYLENDADRLLFWGRLAFLPLHLGLALAVFLVSRRLWGFGGGIASLFLLALSPSILAHAPLVTADFPVTAFGFLAFAAAWASTHGRALPWLLASGLALGLALLSKPSAAFAVPVLLACFAVRGAVTRRAAAAAGAPLLVFAVAVAVVWGAYSFRYAAWRTDDPALAEKQAVLAEFRERSAPESAAARGALAIAEELRLLPEPYLLTLRFTLQQMQRRLSFFAGERSIEGSPLYFPAAFLLKTPLALQLLLAGSVLALLRRRIRLDPVAAAFLLLFPALYFAAAIAASINLGHRHILPIYPFLFVLAGGAAAAARTRAERALLLALVAWFGASSLRVYPHSLTYFNALAGGPRGGIRYLGDSNLDWGQDLAGVGPWMQRHGVARIKLAYFGTALPEYYGFAFDWLPSVGFANDREGPVEVKPGDHLAVSATCLQGFYFQDMAKYRFLDAYVPIDVIGNSIYIFHIVPERRRGSGEK